LSYKVSSKVLKTVGLRLEHFDHGFVEVMEEDSEVSPNKRQKTGFCDSYKST